MLVQPTHVAPGGASGRTENPSEVPAIPVELANLRDELATGELTATEAASRLTTLLATLSDTRTHPTTFSYATFPRWTFGGYCTICFAYGCQNSRCETTVSRYTWAICPDCKGSTYKDIGKNPNGDVTDPCECFFGAVEVEPTEPTGWRPEPSPPAGAIRRTDPHDASQCANPDDPNCWCEVCSLSQNYVWPTNSNGRFVNSLSRSGL